MSPCPPAPDRDLHLWLDGARLRYRETGSGPAVLLIHGWTLDLEMWEFQVAALAQSFRVIRLDRRGFGLSSGRPSLTDDVADAQALCRHLGLRRVCAAGMSQGARVAVQLAGAVPDLVSCIVLDGAPPGIAGLAGGIYDDLPLEEFRNLARERGMDAFRRAWEGHPLLRLRTTDPRARELLGRMLARYRGDDLLAPASNGTVSREAPALEAARQPALVIGGALDLESRRNAADAIARQLPHAQRQVVPDAGHLANLDNPRAYNALLLGFLRQYAS